MDGGVTDFKREVLRTVLTRIQRIVPNSDEFLESGDLNVRHNGLNKSLVYILLFFDEMISPPILSLPHPIIIFLFSWFKKIFPNSS